jgi:hypothetical protein
MARISSSLLPFSPVSSVPPLIDDTPPVRVASAFDGDGSTRWCSTALPRMVRWPSELMNTQKLAFFLAFIGDIMINFFLQFFSVYYWPTQADRCSHPPEEQKLIKQIFKTR